MNEIIEKAFKRVRFVWAVNRVIASVCVVVNAALGIVLAGHDKPGISPFLLFGASIYCAYWYFVSNKRIELLDKAWKEYQEALEKAKGETDG